MSAATGHAFSRCIAPALFTQQAGPTICSPHLVAASRETTRGLNKPPGWPALSHPLGPALTWWQRRPGSPAAAPGSARPAPGAPRPARRGWRPFPRPRPRRQAPGHQRPAPAHRPLPPAAGYQSWRCTWGAWPPGGGREAGAPRRRGRRQMASGRWRGRLQGREWWQELGAERLKRLKGVCSVWDCGARARLGLSAGATAWSARAAPGHITHLTHRKHKACKQACKKQQQGSDV